MFPVFEYKTLLYDDRYAHRLFSEEFRELLYRSVDFLGLFVPKIQQLPAYHSGNKVQTTFLGALLF